MQGKIKAISKKYAPKQYGILLEGSETWYNCFNMGDSVPENGDSIGYNLIKSGEYTNLEIDKEFIPDRQADDPPGTHSKDEKFHLSEMDRQSSIVAQNLTNRSVDLICAMSVQFSTVIQDADKVKAELRKLSDVVLEEYNYIKRALMSSVSPF